MSLRTVFTENLRLKLLSLLFAAVLCFFVTLEVKDEVEIPLQVKYINLPVGLALKDTADRTLSLRLTGARILLIKQQMTGVTLPLNLAGAAAGRATFRSLESHLKLHEGVTPLRISPPDLEIFLVKVEKP